MAWLFSLPPLRPARDARKITLDSFPNRVKAEHPFFRQVELDYAIAWKNQERFLLGLGIKFSTGCF